MTELKPCPFCGGQAELVSVTLPMLADCADVYVECNSCDAKGSPLLFDQDTHNASDLAEIEAEAIAAWNTRAVPRATGDDGELVGRLLEDYCETNDGCRVRKSIPELIHERKKAADRITALSAEVARLNRLINSTGDHWLALVAVHPVQWEGAIDAAMEAACNEIKRLAALGAKP